MSKRFGRQKRRQYKALQERYSELDDCRYRQFHEIGILTDDRRHLMGEIKDLQLRLKTPHHLNIEVERYVDYKRGMAYENKVTQTEVHLKPYFVMFESSPRMEPERAERLFSQSLEQLANSAIAELKDEGWKAFRRLADETS